MDADRDPLGAINIYARKVDAFATADLARAKLFAIHAANALTTAQQVSTLSDAVEARHQLRSEERRVGKEGVRRCRFRGSPSHYKKNTKRQHLTVAKY